MEPTDENRVREIVKEELSTFAPQKKKRAPNKWQAFLKDCVKEQNGELGYTDKVKLCSIIYKDNKNKNSNIPGQTEQPISSPVQPVQPMQNLQPMQSLPVPQPSAQPTYHTQQMPLTDEDVERLFRLRNEKLAKMERQ